MAKRTPTDDIADALAQRGLIFPGRPTAALTKKPYRVKSQKKKDQMAAAEEKRLWAVELRKTGMTYEQIAAEMGLKSGSAVYQMVSRALKLMPAESIDQVRLLELRRLDALLRAVWNKAVNDEEGAINRALRILERRARVLGLDIYADQRPMVTAVGPATINIQSITAVLPPGFEPPQALEADYSMDEDGDSNSN